jgi:hypothetical protein
MPVQGSLVLWPACRGGKRDSIRQASLPNCAIQPSVSRRVNAANDIASGSAGLPGFYLTTGRCVSNMENECSVLTMRLRVLQLPISDHRWPGVLVRRAGREGLGAVRAGAVSSLAPNKANFPGFWPGNGDRAEKQSQSKPISRPRALARSRCTQSCQTKPIIRVHGQKMRVGRKNKANLEEWALGLFDLV